MIRRAGPADLTSIAELVRMETARDYDAAAVAHKVKGLRPGEYFCWLAEVGARPAAMTMIEPRTVLAAGRTWRAGYWTNLFVREEYRATTLYPRLVRTMFREMEDAGLEFLYAAVRRPQVSQAHLAIGMQRAGEVPVLGKPLRPLRLLAKHKRLASIARWLSPLPDALFGSALAFRRVIRQRGALLSDSTPNEDDLSALLRIRERSAGGRMTWVWTTATMRDRFAANPDGDPYHLTCARDATGRVIAGIVHRVAVRGNDIIAGVILDIFVEPQHSRLGTALLAEAERSARSSGGEVMLYLAAGSATDELVRNAGYMRTPEIYTLMSRRAGAKSEPGPEPAGARWRFSFADHDAF